MRPRERYAAYGSEPFSDAELVALGLGTGAAGRTGIEIARELLDRFGGLAGIATAPAGALARVRGVGLARSVRLHASLEAGRRSAARARPRDERIASISPT